MKEEASSTYSVHLSLQERSRAVVNNNKNIRYHPQSEEGERVGAAIAANKRDINGHPGIHVHPPCTRLIAGPSKSSVVPVTATSNDNGQLLQHRKEKGCGQCVDQIG